MITLDALRAALRHSQPWTAMDGLVRAEQATGRKVRDIHAELRALVEPVRALDNPPEDADDAMMDTLDALAGDCRPEDCYKDPPNTTLPTEEEVAALPRWARVAFAARCARRALPFFRINWREAPVGYGPALAWAAEDCERSAARAGSGEYVANAIAAVTLSAYISDAVINSLRDHRRVVEVVGTLDKVIDKLNHSLEDVGRDVYRAVVHNSIVAIAGSVARSNEAYASAQALAGDGHPPRLRPPRPPRRLPAVDRRHARPPGRVRPPLAGGPAARLAG